MAAVEHALTSCERQEGVASSGLSHLQHKYGLPVMMQQWRGFTTCSTRVTHWEGPLLLISK